MPQVLPFGELENSIRDSELSRNLAHELLPLPSRTVTLFHSTHLSSLEDSRRRTAALLAIAINYLFCAGRQRDCLSGFLALLTFPSSRILPSQVVGFHPPLSGVIQLECEPYSYTAHA